MHQWQLPQYDVSKIKRKEIILPGILQQTTALTKTRDRTSEDSHPQQTTHKESSRIYHKQSNFNLSKTTLL